MPVDVQPEAAIRLTDVYKRFGRAEILHGVDLSVPAGEITVLLGPSGAGKTVTISHIVGLIHPDRGTVEIEGKNLAKISDTELNALRQRMAVVLQGTLPFTCGLFFSLNVYENVAFALRQRNRWSEARVHEATMTHLEMVGLRDRAESMPEELSAGMCKRVAIARALALEAKILIVDDFDSGIDGVRLSLLCEMLEEVHRESGATFLVTTHNMSAARRLADNVAVINDGRIVASGPAGEVLGSDEPLVHQLVTGATSGPITLRDV
jgi:phospholipid/cholesterol/gamma-HCH transport system ATP-binding protein